MMCFDFLKSCSNLLEEAVYLRNRVQICGGSQHDIDCSCLQVLLSITP